MPDLKLIIGTEEIQVNTHTPIQVFVDSTIAQELFRFYNAPRNEERIVKVTSNKKLVMTA